MDSYQKEINELHQFFQDWFDGTLAKTTENYSRFTRTLGSDFHIISPSGQLTQRQPLIDGLWEEHNGRHNFRIWIENYQLLQKIGQTAIVTYEEWQQAEGEAVTARVSTAVFQELAAAPNGLLWLHVHETWIEAD